MGNVSFKALTDFTKHNANLACTCARCGHRGVVDRDKAWQWYHLHCWPTAIEVLPDHLKCHKCGGRPNRIQATWEEPTFPEWMSTQDLWRRLHRRLRG